MDELRTVTRDLGRLTKTVTALTAPGRTQRVGLDFSPSGLGQLAAGVTPVDVAWPVAFPDPFYSVTVTPIHAAANLGQFFWCLQSGSRTANGCTILVRNTSGAPLSIGLDITAERN